MKTIKITTNMCVLRAGRNLFTILTMLLTANEIGNFQFFLFIHVF